MDERKSFLERWGLKIPSGSGERLSQRNKRHLDLAMCSNGYFPNTWGEWRYDKDFTQSLSDSLDGQRVSFFGPGGIDNNFFSERGIAPKIFKAALGQPKVIETFRRYSEVGEGMVSGLAFLLGGIVRYLEAKGKTTDDIVKAVEFAAKMVNLGKERSGINIASVMAMYIISGGPLEEDKYFAGDVYRMAEAVDRDPIDILKTEDLGLSQAARLYFFQEDNDQSFPDIEEHLKAFDEFPTVGAEFHFPPDAPSKYPNFWQRLAILNMSQYHGGSYVQLSRNDRDVIEVRMNPSVLPVTIANWNRLKLLLPELNQAFFTITINRKSKGRDFYWKEKEGPLLLNKLRAIGMLCYAALFEKVPPIKKPEQIDFGKYYLGQTVRINNGKYIFSGNWGGGYGEYGQLAIYAGFGDNLPHLAYHLSMALAQPDILDSILNLSGIRTLQDALDLKPYKIKGIFAAIENQVQNRKELRNAAIRGQQIVELLSP